MSPADKIAVRVKSQINLSLKATAIVAGKRVVDILQDNPDPCDPPDLTGNFTDGYMFCGLRLLGDSENPDQLAFLIPIP